MKSFKNFLKEATMSDIPHEIDDQIHKLKDMRFELEETEKNWKLAGLDTKPLLDVISSINNLIENMYSNGAKLADQTIKESNKMKSFKQYLVESENDKISLDKYQIFLDKVETLLKSKASALKNKGCKVEILYNYDLHINGENGSRYCPVSLRIDGDESLQIIHIAREIKKDIDKIMKNMNARQDGHGLYFVVQKNKGDIKMVRGFFDSKSVGVQADNDDYLRFTGYSNREILKI